MGEFDTEPPPAGFLSILCRNMSSNPLHICTRHVFRVMTAMLRAAALLCLCVTALSISADPDPETDPFLARYINALHAYNNNSAFASPTELSAALFPAWKQLVLSCLTNLFA
jgi:hypothetical protein